MSFALFVLFIWAVCWWWGSLLLCFGDSGTDSVLLATGDGGGVGVSSGCVMLTALQFLLGRPLDMFACLVFGLILMFIFDA